MGLNFGLLKTQIERKNIVNLRGGATDTVSAGNGDFYAIIGYGNNITIQNSGSVGVSGTFRNLIVNVRSNGAGTTYPTSEVQVGTISGGSFTGSNLDVMYGDSETGMKENHHNELHVSKGQRIAIEVYAGEGGTNMEGISWSVEFEPDKDIPFAII